MKSQSYEDWKSVFDEELEQVWNSLLGKKELQRISMMLCAIRKEFQIVTVHLEEDIANLKQKLDHRNHLSLSLSNVGNLQDHSKSISETIEDTDKTMESPDLFGNILQNSSSGSENNTTVILSDEDDTKLENSPIIKKRRKHSRLKENVDYPPSLCFDADIVDLVKSSNLDLQKGKSKTSSVEGSVTSQQSLFKAPLHKEQANEMDCSVIANTPELKPKKNKGNISKGSLLFMSKKKPLKKSNVTLTQMFSGSGKRNAKENVYNRSNICERSFDSDVTKCDQNINQDITKMSISEMVNFINEDVFDGKNVASKVSEHNEQIRDPVKEAVQSFSLDHDEADVSEIFDPLEEGLDELAEGLNEYFAKANGVAGNAVPGPVVRGKARKDLPAWSCKECERFYINQDLSLDAIKRLSKKCSKHRGITKPREDTVPGFLNLVKKIFFLTHEKCLLRT